MALLSGININTNIQDIKSSRLDDLIDKFAEIGGTLGSLVILVVALALGFAGLVETAEYYHFSGWKKYLFPILVDGIILTQSFVVLRRQRFGEATTFNWSLLLVFEVASLIINGSHGAGIHEGIGKTIMGVLIHALPPIALFLITKSMSLDIKSFRNRTENTNTIISELEEKILSRDKKLQQVHEEQSLTIQKLDETTTSLNKSKELHENTLTELEKLKNSNLDLVALTTQVSDLQKTLKVGHYLSTLPTKELQQLILIKKGDTNDLNSKIVKTLQSKGLVTKDNTITDKCLSILTNNFN